MDVPWNGPPALVTSMIKLCNVLFLLYQKKKKKLHNFVDSSGVKRFINEFPVIFVAHWSNIYCKIFFKPNKFLINIDVKILGNNCFILQYIIRSMWIKQSKLFT